MCGIFVAGGTCTFIRYCACIRMNMVIHEDSDLTKVTNCFNTIITSLHDEMGTYMYHDHTGMADTSAGGSCPAKQELNII